MLWKKTEANTQFFQDPKLADAIVYTFSQERLQLYACEHYVEVGLLNAILSYTQSYQKEPWGKQQW